MKNVEWGEYQYHHFFVTKTVTTKLSKADLTQSGKVPVYSSESTNNGVAGNTNKKPDFVVDEETPIYIVFGDHTRSFNIAEESFCVMDNVKVLKPKQAYSKQELMYIISSWKKCIPDQGYARHWSIAKTAKFWLPVTKAKKIDFHFMESCIAKLEAQCITELNAYLQVTGLRNYTLTEVEKRALEAFETGAVLWKEYHLAELFDILSYKKRFDANKVGLCETGGFPYIVRMSTNNGQKGFINADEKYLNDGNTISFGQDTATMFYQERPYFTGDKIKILKAKYREFNKNNAPIFLAGMRKAFRSFAWGSTSFSVGMIEKQKVFLPMVNNEIAFDFMEAFHSAI